MNFFDIIPLLKYKNMLFSKKNESEQIQDGFIYKIFGTALGSVVLFMVEVLQILVIAAVIIIPVRYYLVKPFVVEGASMEPNFYDDEYLIIDEISYRFGDAQRGDVIVFVPPSAVNGFYIKRIIGLPGETVEILDGSIIIYNDEYPNGSVLSEDYIDEYTHGMERVVLGLDEFYVLGDNRDASLDSRKIGPIKQDSIVGKVWIRGFPLDRAGFIEVPNYK